MFLVKPFLLPPQAQKKCFTVDLALAYFRGKGLSIILRLHVIGDHALFLQLTWLVIKGIWKQSDDSERDMNQVSDTDDYVVDLLLWWWVVTEIKRGFRPLPPNHRFFTHETWLASPLPNSREETWRTTRTQTTLTATITRYVGLTFTRSRNTTRSRTTNMIITSTNLTCRRSMSRTRWRR